MFRTAVPEDVEGRYSVAIHYNRHLNAASRPPRGLDEQKPTQTP
jgi:hypothetical protein